MDGPLDPPGLLGAAGTDEESAGRTFRRDGTVVPVDPVALGVPEGLPDPDHPLGEPGALDRSGVENAFDVMTSCELPLQARLVEYLRSRPDVRIFGPAHGGPSRVGTVSFVHDTKSSREITEVVVGSGIAVRHGHMYAYHLCEALGMDPVDGVVRVSLVHYNTPDEIERLIGVFDRALG